VFGAMIRPGHGSMRGAAADRVILSINPGSNVVASGLARTLPLQVSRVGQCFSFPCLFYFFPLCLGEHAHVLTPLWGVFFFFLLFCSGCLFCYPSAPSFV
jgi:hypothetical protein